jgi:hypothetical protein
VLALKRDPCYTQLQMKRFRMAPPNGMRLSCAAMLCSSQIEDYHRKQAAAASAAG